MPSGAIGGYAAMEAWPILKEVKACAKNQTRINNISRKGDKRNKFFYQLPKHVMAQIFFSGRRKGRYMK